MLDLYLDQSDEDSLVSSSSFVKAEVEMMKAHSTKMISNLFEKYYWKDPVLRNDELITNFDGVNAGFRKILELYEKRKACGINFIHMF